MATTLSKRKRTVGNLNANIQKITVQPLQLTGVTDDIPPWGQTLINQITEIVMAIFSYFTQLSFQYNLITLTAQHAEVKTMCVEIKVLNAKMYNNTEEFAEDNLMEIRNTAGDPFPTNFPKTRGEIAFMTGPQLDVWLTYYGLTINDSIQVKRRRFYRTIGVRSIIIG